ncbi:hypothetical protein [Clostridium vincentii]|uniref:Uncharacterized protein n=1 Tax=Clostridium vincentii TaxID=52704 RepID=A0A2T0BB60_9CLOT|nr:hypothetical protein [Clostridium vincentii]PRR81130.1 hypothetical protein CLVI_27220 [Clostridium vincentii]
MYKSINVEELYPQLNPKIKEEIQEVYRAKAKYEFLAMVSVILYSIIGLIFIYMFRNIIFKKHYFFNLNSLFNFCKIIIIIGGALFIVSSINNIPKNAYKKAVISLTKLFIMDICDCTSTCHCRNLVISDLHKHGINLLS